MIPPPTAPQIPVPMFVNELAFVSRDTGEVIPALIQVTIVFSPSIILEHSMN